MKIAFLVALLALVAVTSALYRPRPTVENWYKIAGRLDKLAYDEMDEEEADQRNSFGFNGNFNNGQVNVGANYGRTLNNGQVNIGAGYQTGAGVNANAGINKSWNGGNTNLQGSAAWSQRGGVNAQVGFNHKWDDVEEAEEEEADGVALERVFNVKQVRPTRSSGRVVAKPARNATKSAKPVRPQRPVRPVRPGKPSDRKSRITREDLKSFVKVVKAMKEFLRQKRQERFITKPRNVKKDRQVRLPIVKKEKASVSRRAIKDEFEADKVDWDKVMDWVGKGKQVYDIIKQRDEFEQQADAEFFKKIGNALKKVGRVAQKGFDLYQQYGHLIPRN